MVLTSQLVKYYIAVLISVNPPSQPPQGWVQMLQPFDSRAECKSELHSNKGVYFMSIMKHHIKIINKVEMMECMTQWDIDEINDDLGHPPSRRKKEGMGV